MSMKSIVFATIFFTDLVLAASPILIGIDGEFTQANSTSAQAIQQGMQVAIDEINRTGGVLGGRKFEVVVRNNRSVSAIGVDNLRELSGMKDLVAVFGDKYSPIYIESLPVVHELGILLLDPWGSADQITEHNFKPSYTFRLSLKDAWAGPALVRFSKEKHGAHRVGVLLPNTAWGRSNQAAITNAASRDAVNIVGQRWYNMGDTSLVEAYDELQALGAQAIILVANEVEGAALVREVGALPANRRLPVISHWGVSGGNFAALAGESLRQVDFSVIQTYSFIGQKNPIAERVLAALKKNYQIPSGEYVKSPVGVAHAYDLMHLLAKAIDKAGSTDRRKIRDALENLGPHEGLVQRYARPFTSERHDALSIRNIFFARYTADDILMPIKTRTKTTSR